MGSKKKLPIIKRVFIKLLILIPGKFKIYKDVSVSPVWIFGMFRSGTSFLCQLLSDSGVNFGKKRFLLQPIGILRDLNPRGFYEDFIFAEISRYLLFKLNKSGDNPPSADESRRACLESVDVNELIKLSFYRIREDRISFFNKIIAFVILKMFGLNFYLKRMFGSPVAVKIPLLSFFHCELIKYWPNSKFIVVFRNPASVIESAKKLTDHSNDSLYISYSTTLIEMAKHYKMEENILYISYDSLIESPASSIKSLSDFLGLESERVLNSYKNNFDKSLLRNRSQQIIGNKHLEETYEKLLSFAK